MSSRFVLYSSKAGFYTVRSGVFNVEAEWGVWHIDGADLQTLFLSPAD